MRWALMKARVRSRSRGDRKARAFLASELGAAGGRKPAPVHEEMDYTVLSDTEHGQLEKIYSNLLKQPPATAAIFRYACGLGLEGIVSKRIGSRYVRGRTRAWLKTKNPDFKR